MCYACFFARPPSQEVGVSGSGTITQDKYGEFRKAIKDKFSSDSSDVVLKRPAAAIKDLDEVGSLKKRPCAAALDDDEDDDDDDDADEEEERLSIRTRPEPSPLEKKLRLIKSRMGNVGALTCDAKIKAKQLDQVPYMCVC